MGAALGKAHYPAVIYMHVAWDGSQPRPRKIQSRSELMKIQGQRFGARDDCRLWNDVWASETRPRSRRIHFLD